MQIGDTVYFYEHWGHSVEKGTIKEFKDCDGVKCAEVKSIEAVNENGEKVGNTYGTSTRALQHLYGTAKEVFEAHRNKSEATVRQYCKEIKDVGDLLTFPLYNCLNGEEYTNYDAIKAFKQRAKELLGFEFDDKDQVFILPTNKFNYASMDSVNQMTKEKAIQIIDQLIDEIEELVDEERI